MKGQTRSSYLLLVFLVSLASPSTVAPAEPGNPTAPAKPGSEDPPISHFRTGLMHLREDAKYLITFPRQQTHRRVVTTSIILGGVAALVLLDDEIREEVREHRNDTLDRWESRIEPLGRGDVTVLGAAIIYVAGALWDREPMTETGRTLFEALFFTEVLTKLSKGITGRKDPGPDARASDFFSYGGSGIFPSGHTSRAFAVAAVLAERYGRGAAWVAYPLATLVGLFRIESDSHWASDVVAGAALGYAVGKTIARRRADRRRRQEGNDQRMVTLLPMVSPGRREAGLFLRVTF